MPRQPTAGRRTACALNLAGASLGALAVAVPLGLATAAQAADADPGSRTVGELVVTGQRLSEAQAIATQKEAIQVTSVVSADDLGKLPDANVADALARVPGVNVIVNQETGEGEFVTVRGFAGTFNAYSINGVRVAQTDPDTRSVSMTVLPPNGLQAIKVSKTLTPDMDGDAIGGTVDFRTPTAFDFRRPVMRLFLGYGINDRARERGSGDDTKQVQFDFTRRFMDDRLGVYATGYWGEAQGANEETENDGEWEPFHFRKDNNEPIDAHSLYLPGIDLDFRRNQQTRYGGNFSIDWKGERQTLYARGQVSRFERIADNNYTDFRSRPTPRLVQKVFDDANLAQPENAIIGVGAKGNIYGYTTAQIVDQDHDGVITDADRKSSSSYWSLFGRSGIWDPKAFQFARTFQTDDQNQTLATFDVGGQTQLSRLTLDYDASYSWGEKASPGSYSVSYNCDKCAYPLNATGLLWSSFDPRFPLPQLPAFAQDAPKNDALLPFDGAGLSKDKQTDKRYAVKLDGRYDVGGMMDYVKAGVKFLRSERTRDYTPLWDGDLPGANLAASGLVEENIPSFLHGTYYFGSVMGRSQVLGAIDKARAASPQSYGPGDIYGSDKQATETIYAGYALATFNFDALQVVAGGRVEHTQVHNRFWVSDSKEVNGVVVDASRFDTTDRDYTNVLPSVTATYRPGSRWVYRAAAWTSFSRPEYQAIAGGESITYLGTGASRQIVSISRGNPDLKPAEAFNLDASAEFYPDPTSLLSAGVFYKHIKNFIFSLGNTVDSTTQSGSIEISQPKNGQDATIYGVELNVIKDLKGLAPPFDGFGVEGNVTVQHSSAETGLDYRKGHPIRFVGAPNLLYNAGLTYQNGRFEAKLSYNYQGKYIESLRNNSVDKWVRPNRSLDFHARVYVLRQLSVDFDVNNILDGWRYYTTKGDSPSYQKDYMEPGRTFLVKAAYTY